jgi:hypothetical protein
MMFSGEMGLNRVEDEIESRATLSGAGGDDRPDAFAPHYSSNAPQKRRVTSLWKKALTLAGQGGHYYVPI